MMKGIKEGKFFEDIFKEKEPITERIRIVEDGDIPYIEIIYQDGTRAIFKATKKDLELMANFLKFRLGIEATI